MSFLIAAHPWLKAFHIIAVIAWMAGMLYLPRLFVYHADSPVGSPQSETFKVMERKLLRIIINPSMIAVFVLGGLMLGIPGAGDDLRVVSHRAHLFDHPVDCFRRLDGDHHRARFRQAAGPQEHRVGRVAQVSPGMTVWWLPAISLKQP